MWDGDMQAALPKLVACPGGERSMSVTRKPAATRCQAQQAPTVPAPITMQCCPGVADGEFMARRLPAPVRGCDASRSARQIADELFQKGNDAVQGTDCASPVTVGNRTGQGRVERRRAG